MQWEAAVGRLALSGPGVGDLLPLLRYGEWAQIGKGTTFGLGRYALSKADDA